LQTAVLTYVAITSLSSSLIMKRASSRELGVIRIKFRVEDGSYELHFRVPYDYDSEYQDIYYRIGKY